METKKSEENPFNEIVALVKELSIKCHHAREFSFEMEKDFLISEVKEVEKAITEKDYDNLKEELGDVIWDILAICAIAGKKGLFNAEDVLQALKVKIKERNPHVFGNEKANSLEDALKIKKKAKELWKQKK